MPMFQRSFVFHSVLYDCKWDIFEFWTDVGQTNVKMGSMKLWWPGDWNLRHDQQDISDSEGEKPNILGFLPRLFALLSFSASLLHSATDTLLVSSAARVFHCRSRHEQEVKQKQGRYSSWRQDVLWCTSLLFRKVKPCRWGTFSVYWLSWFSIQWTSDWSRTLQLVHFWFLRLNDWSAIHWSINNGPNMGNKAGKEHLQL